MSILTIFTRAAHGLALTPEERAFLKLAQGVVWAGVIAAVGALTSLLSSGHFTLNEPTLIGIATAALVAILNAVAKLVSARGDSALGGAITAAASDLDAHSPLHQQSAPPEANASAI